MSSRLDERESALAQRLRGQIALDLRRVAEWAGTPVQTIQDLNPELPTRFRTFSQVHSASLGSRSSWAAVCRSPSTRLASTLR